MAFLLTFHSVKALFINFFCYLGYFLMAMLHILSPLNEGHSALHRQVTVTVHVDAASVRRAGSGSCASSPGLVT